MLGSELAQELDIDPTVLSKRLSVYHEEAQTERTRLLDEDTIEGMRQAHKLLKAKKAKNFRQAVLMVLGEYEPPIDADQARQVVKRLDAIEASLSQLTETVNWMAEYMRERRGKQDQTAARPVIPSPSAQAMAGSSGGQEE
ncbi:hypothetical protein DGo_PF0027 (plasmid) [Deinococcus gobiensis I-0]|uniref:Uncharacterized protein n=2 Tax=Deinococcus TaxID=1298 RepID=H8H403_DEIGI|nr:hypothetical protein DGo_PF0027 [Deinococcus gobiensis I-0]